MRWTTRALLALMLAFGSLCLVAWLTLHWGILPHIEQWRPELESHASRVLGVPVRIGGISVRSGSWVPAFELRDVELLDPQQRPALSLPRISAALSVRSLLAFELRFKQLFIEGAQLDIRRDAGGHIFVAGFDLAHREAGADSALADWLFSQREVVIRGGVMRWTDESRGAPPLALSDVQLVIRNTLIRHDLRLDATPEAAWGERFTLLGRLRQPLLASAGDWHRWSGEIHASLPRVDVHLLRQQLTLPFELGRGEGALRAWVEIAAGEPRAATVDVDLKAVTMQLAADVEPLDIEQLAGRLVGQRTADGVSVELQRLAFVTGDGLRWPQGDMKLTWHQREGEAARGGAFSAQQLDLDVMARIAARIPIGQALRSLLAELHPQGQVSALAATWDGALDAPAHYQVKALFSGLSLAAHASDTPGALGRPGVRNATVQVSATESGGQAQLGVSGGAIELPGVFADPVLPMDTLATALTWKIEPAATAGSAPQVSVQAQAVRFANADARGEFNATWSTGPGSGFARGGRYPGQLELGGALTRGVAARTARYLPLGLPDATRQYVERAVRSGTIASASFRVKGDLWDFPFHNLKSAKDGEFRIAAKVEDLNFAYVPGTTAEPSPWPAMTQVGGELVFDRASMEIHDAHAQIGSVALSGVKGGIQSLTERPVLAIEGKGRGPLPDMVRFVNTTPVGEWIGHALTQASTAGPADLSLTLAIPLGDAAATQVKGGVALAGNEVRLTPDSPAMGNARGRVDFSETGFSVVGASARIYGGEATFEGGSTADGNLRFNGQGTAAAEALRRATELGALSRLAGAWSGQTGYRVALGFVHGEPEISVTSNLVGLASDLPAPLRKTAETPLAMRYETRLAVDAGSSSPPKHDTLRFELGSIVQAQFVRDLSGAAPRVLRGGIGLFEPAPAPASGVQAAATLAELDAKAWQASAERLFGPGDANVADAPGGYVPDRVGLRVQQLDADNRHLTRVVAGLTRDGSTWHANVDADQLNGYVEYRPQRPGAAGLVHARLSRLSVPRSEVEQVESLLDSPPESVPALDIVVDDFELRGRHLGRVEIEAVNRFAGDGRGELKDGAREWHLSRFNVSNPDAQLSATGTWADAGTPGGPRRAVMDFKLALADGGALLERLGKGKVVRGAKGQMTGQVSWLGSPLTLDYPSLSGNVKVAIESGQFLKVDPGAARLLSVLNLQALPRRLVLDFRDVFQEGFAFDTVSGDLRIAHGVAQTNNLRMRGLQAAVLMEGSADIARETQDLRVVVVPEINAGTASLVYAAINPLVGLGTFLAQAFLRKPLMQANTREFHLSGSWDDPQVERVERPSGTPLPEIDPPASGASAPASGSTQ